MQSMRLFRILSLSWIVLAASIELAHSQCCIAPHSEVSSITNHYSITVTAFQQLVSDAGGDNLNGIGVKEATISSGNNGCYYTGAPFPPTSTVTGGTWIIEGQDPNGLTANGVNQWGTDLDGDSPSLIDIIRTHASLPCTDNIPQTMYSQTSCNAAYGYPYFYNTQTVTITPSNVTNCRAGVCDTISW